jgi:hypothetical protein
VCVLVATLFKGGISEDETNSETYNPKNPRAHLSLQVRPFRFWLSPAWISGDGEIRNFGEILDHV